MRNVRRIIEEREEQENKAAERRAFYEERGRLRARAGILSGTTFVNDSGIFSMPEALNLDAFRKQGLVGKRIRITIEEEE